MDTVQKHIYSDYHSPSSEPYRVYLNANFAYVNDKYILFLQHVINRFGVLFNILFDFRLEQVSYWAYMNEIKSPVQPLMYVPYTGLHRNPLSGEKDKTL
jgi:hypothetical protein